MTQAELLRLVQFHQCLYYCFGRPVISDYAYDQLEKKLESSPLGSDQRHSYPADIYEMAKNVAEYMDGGSREAV